MLTLSDSAAPDMDAARPATLAAAYWSVVVLHQHETLLQLTNTVALPTDTEPLTYSTHPTAMPATLAPP